MFVAMKEARDLRASLRDGFGGRQYWSDLTEAITTGQLKPSEFSINEVFCAFVEDGHECVSTWNPRHNGGKVSLIESGIDTAAYANIIGQIVYTEIEQGFENPVFLHPRLAKTVPTQFSGERIPGISGLGDEAEVIPEGGHYPVIGNTENWTDTPQTEKRGFIVPVTREAIFFDRTAMVLSKASSTGEWLGINKEKRVLDAVFGITNTYRRNGQPAITTYGDVTGTRDFDNLAATNPLVDWTDIENAELLFDGMDDPDTGEPIVLMPNALIVPSALAHTARRIISATEVRHGDGGASTPQTISGNPVGNQYEILTNQFVSRRTGNDTTWFLGDPMGAFNYMENWPIESIEAPVNSEAEFLQDIVQRFKVSERGVITAREPRKMVKSTS